MRCANCGGVAIWVFEAAGIDAVPYCRGCVPRAYVGTRHLRPAEEVAYVSTELPELTIEKDGLNILVEVTGTGGIVAARFGDDTAADSTTGAVSHTYAQPGKYRVSVATATGTLIEEITVTDNTSADETTSGESDDDASEDDDADPENPED